MTLFGPSGNSESFYAEGNESTLQAGKWLKDKGLDLFEYSFGRGYRMNFETAKLIGDEFAKHQIEISLHAPYFINFASEDPVLLGKTYGYITTGIKFLKAFGAKRLVFQPARQRALCAEIRSNARRLRLGG